MKFLVVWPVVVLHTLWMAPRSKWARTILGYCLLGRTPPGSWCTAKGEWIAVTRMTDQHLVNTIRMLRRRPAQALAAQFLMDCTVGTLLHEADRRGLRV